ncbi:hypothetical protein SAMN05660662_2671 [Blastococcus aurantiacus]|uniref:Uncharacterized protein n=1 Tax=Blastococcus aurantiacus TaxID=1550231 RepID=A0A1G7MG95_9ACTN|nr:hypothetical protein [Blastococcus aurantiacus]SDF60230.1 hypothetical protein SAMN05660662_2671 [Blastococcus aurantiacus]
MSAHAPRTAEQVLDLPDASVLQLLAARLSSTAADTVHGLHQRPGVVTAAALTRVRYLLLLLAFDTSPFACPACSTDLDAALHCAAEHGALAARAQNQADRAARRLADLITTGTTSRWD